MKWLKQHSFPLWIIACNLFVVMLQSIGRFFLTDSHLLATIEPSVFLASLVTIIITTMVQLFIDERKNRETMSLLLWALIVLVLGVFLLAFKDAKMFPDKRIPYLYAICFISVWSVFISFKLLCRLRFESIDLVDNRKNDQDTLNDKLKRISGVKNETEI